MTLDASLSMAEGVETEEQARALTEMGGPITQGFLFAPALPADEFVDLVIRNAVHGTLVSS